jgi:hypothetical protein
MPATTPAVAPTRPNAPASSRTVRRTCRLLAPTARSSANCRTRWVTSIVNVLAMTNMPTSNATATNASSDSRVDRAAEPASSRASAASSAPVLTVRPGAVISRRTAALTRGPGSAASSTRV